MWRPAQWIEYGLIHGIIMQKCMGFFLFECWSFNNKKIRGIERRKIFRSDYDRKNFLNRLGKLIPETQTDSILRSTFNF
ncbi:hypothetical protein LCGC14_1739340 [marine sediment metagenome]|uniref:Uncharacterized protein n=1 Tax=marine sediment metagenome TaxID=412755 RepID=A0A0F9K6V9_9ZZZZ